MSREVVDILGDFISAPQSRKLVLFGTIEGNKAPSSPDDVHSPSTNSRIHNSPYSSGIINNTLTTIASLSATGLCSQLFVVNNVIIAELFPTAIRNVAASFVSTVARFGGVISPNLFLIENYWIAAPYLVIVILMSINLIIFQFFIPETKGSPMPDKFPDKSERMWRRKEEPTHLIERVDTNIAKLADQE